MSKDLFYKSLFTIQYILADKIEVISLVGTYATKYDFINKKFAKKVYQVLEIKFQYLIKPKQIQRFNSKAAKSVTHAIYLTLTIVIYTESFAFLLITKLGYYPMIFV